VHSRPLLGLLTNKSKCCRRFFLRVSVVSFGMCVPFVRNVPACLWTQGAADFVKGCGVFCDPSYLLEYNEQLDSSFDAAPMATTLMLQDFDVRTLLLLFGWLVDLLGLDIVATISS
jgi:hypothetical protein